MTQETAIKLFESKKVRSVWDAEKQKWQFAIVDVIAVLTASTDPGAYWRKLKERLKRDCNETVTNCHGLKMLAADGKMRIYVASLRETGFPVWFRLVRLRRVGILPAFRRCCIRLTSAYDDSQSVCKPWNSGRRSLIIPGLTPDA